MQACLQGSVPSNIHAALTCDHCCRHAFGDQYRATDLVVKEPGKLELVFTPDSGGEVQKWEVHQFDGPGVGMGMYNIEESIKGFAKASFEYALDKKWYVICYTALCNMWYEQGCTFCTAIFGELQSEFLTCTASCCQCKTSRAATTYAIMKRRLLACMQLRCQSAMMNIAQLVSVEQPSSTCSNNTCKYICVLLDRCIVTLMITI